MEENNNLILKVEKKEDNSSELNITINKNAEILEVYRIILSLSNQIIKTDKDTNIDSFLNQFKNDYLRLFKDTDNIIIGG